MDSELLEYILLVSRKMAETRTLLPLLNTVVFEALKIVGAERGYVVLVQPDGSFDFQIKLDNAGNELEHAHDQVSTSVLDEVIGTGQPVMLRNAVNDPRFGQAESVVILQLRSIICVPLIVRGETTGAIYVENRTVRNRFQQQDVALLTLFANQAAVAIENAAIYDKLEARVAARTHELEMARQQLERGWHEAIEANRLRTVWLSQVAHDMRAPLGIASGAVALMLDGTLGDTTPEQREWLGKALKSISHTSSLTEQVSYLARMDEGKVALNIEPFDPQQLLVSSFEMAKGLPWSPHVAVRLKIPDPLPWLPMDHLRVQQVVLNMLGNAQKFTDSGEVTLSARVNTEHNELWVSVADTGIGIPPQFLGQIFERFKKIRLENTRNREGTGLGLAICKELIEMHGGRIWVESEPGVGTTFIFALPIDAPANPAPAVIDSEV
ncbi:MAG: hypothetical protein Kow0031_05660 [Anaerolineae bacterium]